MAITPSASYSITVRVEIKNRPGMLGRVTSAIGEAGGDIGAVDIVELLKDIVVRDFTINARDDRHGQEIVAAVRRVEGARVVNVSDRTFPMHLGGKIEIHNKVSVKTRDDLSMTYTPGVARVCLATKEDREGRPRGGGGPGGGPPEGRDAARPAGPRRPGEMVDGTPPPVGSRPPAAAYDASRLTGNAMPESFVEVAFEILAGAHVAVTPGIDFGAAAEGYLRVSYASGLERIGEGVRRIGEFLRGRGSRRDG